LGGKDDPSVSVEDLRAWEVETTGGFELLLFKGDHRYVESGAEAVLSFLVPTLKDLGRSGGSSPGASPS
jgi:surfactin synthase thioesterase subunit